jgi:hypothetical protein
MRNISPTHRNPATRRKSLEEFDNAQVARHLRFLIAPRQPPETQVVQTPVASPGVAGAIQGRERLENVRDAKAAVRSKFSSLSPSGSGDGQPSAFVWGFRSNSNNNSGGTASNPQNKVSDL